MTTGLTTTPYEAPATDPHRTLATVLRADAAVTAALGAVALLGPDVWGAAPGWLPRVVGAVFVVAALDVALVSRWTGRRLRLAGTVVGELALATAAASAVVLATADLPAAGALLVGVVGLLSAGFGVAELRLARRAAGT